MEGNLQDLMIELESILSTTVPVNTLHLAWTIAIIWIDHLLTEDLILAASPDAQRLGKTLKTTGPLLLLRPLLLLVHHQDCDRPAIAASVGRLDTCLLL